MGRKRKLKPIEPWERIHDELAEIFMAMKIQKCTREHFKMTYWGTGKKLKESCIKILNNLEATDKELEYGLSPENRWT